MISLRSTDIRFIWAILFLWILSIFNPTNSLLAQGCSDAGICSSQGYASETSAVDSGKAPSYFRFSTGYALGEKFTHQFTLQPEFIIGLFKNTQVSIRMPYQFNSGKLGFHQGLGDPILVVSQRVSLSSDLSLSISGGIRFPINRAAHDSLPMPYQTSLGTLDALLAMEIHYRALKLRTGYQRVLHHQNENRYLPPTGLPLEDVYFASRNLRRGNDWMLRADYLFPFSKWTLIPGMLMVWRLSPDEYQNAQNVGIEFPDSDGPTFNLIFNASIPLKNNWVLEPLLAAPVFAREERPDGLTRNLVATITLMKRLSPRLR
jgi:hypothetical protein